MKSRMLSCILIMSLIVVSISIPVYGDEKIEPVQYDDYSENHTICEESPLTMCFEKNRYEIDEKIPLTFSYPGGISIENVEIVPNGFDFEINKNSEGTLSVNLLMKANVETASFEVLVIDKEYKYCNELFAINTDKGIFISRGCVDSAWDDYFYYGVLNKEYDFDIYNNLINNYYSEKATESIIVDSYSAISVNSTTNRIEGYLTWIDDSENRHPLAYGKVQLLNSIGLNVIATTYTDASGYYAFSVNYDQCLPGITIKVWCGSENSTVYTTNGGSYSYLYSISSVTPGSHYTVNYSFSMSSTIGQAMQISQAIMWGTKFVRIMNGSYISDISTYYPHNSSSNSGDYYSSNKIYICPTNSTDTIQTYAAWDPILHEYGHHVQKVFGLSDPLVSGQHGMNVDLNESYSYTKSKSIKLAWAEALPTVFSELIQQYYSSSIGSVPYVANGQYDYRTGGYTRYENMIYRLGEACEGSIIGVLWDMYDTNVESHDNISMSYYSFWNCIKNSQAKTMSDFTQYVYSDYSSISDGFNSLLSYYKIAPSDVVMSGTNISWKSNGMRILFNNSCTIDIYDNSGHLLLTKTNIPTYSNDSTITYTLSSNELSFLMQSTNIIKIYVKGRQLSSPITGYYISMPIIVSI